MKKGEDCKSTGTPSCIVVLRAIRLITMGSHEVPVMSRQTNFSSSVVCRSTQRSIWRTPGLRDMERAGDLSVETDGRDERQQSDYCVKLARQIKTS
jgi:hypothetical protein